MKLGVQEIQRAGNPALLSAPRNHIPLPPTIEPSETRQETTATKTYFTVTKGNQVLRESRKMKPTPTALKFRAQLAKRTRNMQGRHAQNPLYNTKTIEDLWRTERAQRRRGNRGRNPNPNKVHK